MDTKSPGSPSSNFQFHIYVVDEYRRRKRDWIIIKQAKETSQRNKLASDINSLKSPTRIPNENYHHTG
jgi:hypothetical protein